MAYPLLQVNNLKIDFNTQSGMKTAVNGISFNIEAGEMVALVGESGSGKTISSLSILKLQPKNAIIDSASQLLFSEDGIQQLDLLQLKENEIRKIRGNSISMIFQEPMTSLNPVLSCGFQVLEAIRNHQHISYENARLKVLELFAQVNLPDPHTMFRRYPHELSGGQKQRVMIAMAISCNPQLLIADEPTTALDVTVQHTILQLLKELQREQQRSILYITHDLALVSSIADKVVILYNGTIVEQGPVKAVFSNPQHAYTKALLSCRPSAGAKGKMLPVIEDFMNPEYSQPLSERIKEVKIASANNPISLSTEPLLVVENLIVKYNSHSNFLGKTTADFNAVNNVSFSVYNGETLGLVGESGCGKTTLGKAILQLIPNHSGKVEYKGINLNEISYKELKSLRKNLQIIFQDPYGSLNPRMTIGNAILEPMKIHGIEESDKRRKDKIHALLERVGLSSSFYNRYPHEFSGGQRQRICIARALVLNPDFLICDESVSALDTSVQAQVLNLLNDLKAEYGFTCIFISHDLNVVHYISDRIMVMKNGKIIETGTANQVFYDPKESYTKTLMAANPTLVRI